MVLETDRRRTEAFVCIGRHVKELVVSQSCLPSKESP